MALEDRTARLTILIDPRKKALFERLCAEEDADALPGRAAFDPALYRGAHRAALGSP